MEKQAVVRPGVTPDLEEKPKRKCTACDLARTRMRAGREKYAAAVTAQREARRLEKQDAVSRLAEAIDE